MASTWPAFTRVPSDGNVLPCRSPSCPAVGGVTAALGPGRRPNHTASRSRAVGPTDCGVRWDQDFPLLLFEKADAVRRG